MAKVRSFKAESGISFEYNGQWYKYATSIELEIEPGDNMEEVKRKAWNTVDLEIVKKISEVIGDKVNNTGGF